MHQQIILDSLLGTVANLGRNRLVWDICQNRTLVAGLILVLLAWRTLLDLLTILLVLAVGTF